MAKPVRVTINQLTDWRDDALCHGKWELFDATYEGSNTNEYVDVEKALAICAECPVKRQCRSAGRKEPQGIWGGVVK